MVLPTVVLFDQPGIHKEPEMAKALKQKEISMTIIAETSGLSIEEIQKL